MPPHHHHKHLPRFYENKLQDYAGALEPFDSAFLKDYLHSTYAEVTTYVTRHPAVYVGMAGVAYCFWHVSLSVPLEQLDAPFVAKLVELSLKFARQAVASVSPPRSSTHPTSLLDGLAGIYLTAALVRQRCAAWVEKHPGSPLVATLDLGSARSDVTRFVGGYLQAAQLAVNSDSDEFLYGRVGTLFGLLILAKHFGPEAVPPVILDRLAQAVLKSGRGVAARLRQAYGSSPSPLMYVWPAGDEGKPYLGAAHGLIGIVYVLLHCNSLLASDPQAVDEIHQALRFILSQESDLPGRKAAGGHYPCMMAMEPGSPPPLTSGRQPLVHWCHGAPGAVFLWCKAYQVFADPQYMAAACRAGELVWERGLLRKGPGLCHGTAGNGYALLALWQATKDDKWLHRARQFGRFLCAPACVEFNSRPDHPLSMFEGLAGAMTFAADLMQPETARFPLFAI